MKIGILGGGLAGLTIASKSKHDCEVLEKEKECGGLCRSLQEGGYTFDWGGAHIIYSKNQKILEYMKDLLGDNCQQGKRNNKVFYKGRYVKYPFENGLSDLPPDDNFECLYHYLNNSCKKFSNFKEWVYFTFGKGIAEKYLIPYNQKIWKHPLEKISLHWVERIPKPPVEDVIKSAVGVVTEGYTHQLYFYYPKKGGIQSLIKVLEEKTPAVLKGFQIKKVKKIKEGWMVQGEKESRTYDKLVSTIPIFDLISYLDKVPEKVKKALRNLKYNSLITVMIGLDQDLPDYTAVYVPQKEFLTNRIAFPSTFSKSNVPAGKSSVIAEITTNPKDVSWRLSEKEIIERVADDLEKMGIINKKNILFKKAARSKYAYVVYDKDYKKNVKIVTDFAEKTGIEICGRFAEFEYLNMDACIESALETANKINKKIKNK